MAREHARIWLDIAGDEDVEALSPPAQWLYFRVLLPEPTLNYAGVCDWRPTRLLQKARSLTLDYIEGAAAELEHARFALFSIDTEEALVRSYIRRDELLKNPKYAVAVLKAYRAVSAKTLRAAVVSEVRRANTEHPGYSSWTTKDLGADLTDLMAKKSFDDVPYIPQYTYADPVGIPNHIGNGIGNRIGNHIGNDDPVPITKTDQYADTQSDNESRSVPIPSHPSPLTLHQGGYVSGEPHQVNGFDPTLPPSDRCPKHANNPDPPKCRDCQAARESREAFDEQLAKFKAAQRADFRAEVAACPSCDDAGWLLGADGLPSDRPARCPAHDWEAAHA